MQTHFWKNYLVSFESSFEATDTMVSDLRKSKKSPHILQLFSKVKMNFKIHITSIKGFHIWALFIRSVFVYKTRKNMV